MGKAPTRVLERANLKALMTLSNFSGDITPARLERLVKKAPDAETLVQAFLEEIPLESDVLRRKWRKVLSGLWRQHHPNVPKLPPLPLTKSDTINTFQLLDALSFLDSIYKQPAQLVPQGRDHVLSSRDVHRLLPHLESLSGEEAATFKHEKDVPLLHRLRETLTAARLVRTYHGELRVVNSRLKTFLRLPRTYQFYLLWHVATYHVDWGLFAPTWANYLAVIQGYLPLFWEINQAAELDVPIDKREWCAQLIADFAPLWHEHLGHHPALISPFFMLTGLSLPDALNDVIVNGLLARYGLIQFASDGNFVWTPLGLALLEAESDQTLPCGLKLLR